MSEEEQTPEQQDDRPVYTGRKILVTENKVITGNGITTLSCAELFSQNIISVIEEETEGFLLRKYDSNGDSLSFFVDMAPELVEANTSNVIIGLFANAEIKIQETKERLANIHGE